jgi:hypothetical protein
MPGAEEQNECLGLRYSREAYNIIYILYNVCMYVCIHTYIRTWTCTPSHISFSNSIRVHKRNRNVNSAVEGDCVVLFRYYSVWLNAAVRIRLKELSLCRTLLMQPSPDCATYHIMPCAVRENSFIKRRCHFQGLYMVDSGRINSEYGALVEW